MITTRVSNGRYIENANGGEVAVFRAGKIRINKMKINDSNVQCRVLKFAWYCSPVLRIGNKTRY